MGEDGYAHASNIIIDDISIPDNVKPQVLQQVMTKHNIPPNVDIVASTINIITAIDEGKVTDQFIESVPLTGPQTPVAGQ